MSERVSVSSMDWRWTGECPECTPPSPHDPELLVGLELDRQLRN